VIGADEGGTLQALKSIRAELIDPQASGEDHRRSCGANRYDQR
jgi:hypothetical protein